MKHALVIGGSGMLAGTTVWLAEQGYLVTVVGRNVPKLERVEIGMIGYFQSQRITMISIRSFPLWRQRSANVENSRWLWPGSTMIKKRS